MTPGRPSLIVDQEEDCHAEGGEQGSEKARQGGEEESGESAIAGGDLSGQGAKASTQGLYGTIDDDATK